MKKRDPKRRLPQNHDKQLQGVTLEAVLEKRRLGQALNAKEFAVCAGVSYSTARHWFHLPGFPVFQGVVFWDDFVHWRARLHGVSEHPEPPYSHYAAIDPSTLPPQASRLLLDPH